MKKQFKDLAVGERFFAWGDEFFYDYPKACVFEKEDEHTAVEIEDSVKGCRVGIDPNDIYGTDVLLAPKWLKDQMAAMKLQPPPTAETVARQFAAVEKYRREHYPDPLPDEFIDE